MRYALYLFLGCVSLSMTGCFGASDRGKNKLKDVPVHVEEPADKAVAPKPKGDAPAGEPKKP
jgi:hypothetical protein